MKKKLPTGMPGLDEILCGGLIPSRTYLIMGAPGTGKTTLALQWLIKSRQPKQKALYISLAELKQDIENNLENFGWHLDNIELLDLSPVSMPHDRKLDEYHVFTPVEVEQTSIWKTLFQSIIDSNPDLLVIDSVSTLRFLSADTYQFRKHILELTKFLNRHEITSMLLFEPTERESATSVSLSVDGVLHLRRENSPGYVVELRYLEVEKIRGSAFLSSYHPFKLSNMGVEIFPHIIEKTGKCPFIEEYVTSGVVALDEMLGGGIESGTTTIISGPTGSGKSTLATQFLIHSAAEGKPGLVIMFEESAEFMIHRCLSIGTPIDDLLSKNMLKLVRINPMETYPDELLAMVRALVEEGNYKLVMIDSLRGYTMAMQEFGFKTLLPHLHNLLTYLNRQRVSTFLINEIDTFPNFTEHGLSHACDNMILLRFAERSGKVLKIISCLKKRLGDFQTQSREMLITTNGLMLSDPLENTHGILSGLPYY